MVSGYLTYYAYSHDRWVSLVLLGHPSIYYVHFKDI